MLFGAVGFVLLIACANMANLLLARAVDAAARAGGPPRARIVARAGCVRLMLTESVMLSVLGGVAGARSTVWLRRGADRAGAVGPAADPRRSAIDGQVLAFTARR